jgi:acetyl esterase/lipase
VFIRHPVQVSRHGRWSAAADGSRVWRHLLFSCLTLVLAGCQSTLEHAGIALLYERAELPADQTKLDLAYRSSPGAHPNKHKLDLFLPHPASTDWPTLVFIHGGGWTAGDRAQEAAGETINRNIGRYFARQGVATAVISYRLMPEATWHEQLDDVAAAVRYLREAVPGYGGDADRLYLSGHSAGAWLAARMGLDRQLLRDEGIPPASICGLVLVSGAAYDVTDPETYRLGASRAYFVERLDDGQPDWAQRASVLPLASTDSPATLILYGKLEPAKLRRQSELLVAALEAADAPVHRLELPWETHQSIVLTLSRGNSDAVPAMQRLIDNSCQAR